ncbi:MAG TPA: NAD(P)H-dependent oxidoreductase subunit E [Armatimonadota bacterium]
MNKIKITICAGTTCYLMGGAYLQTIEEHLDPSIRSMVEIEGCRCLGHCKDDKCGNAPYVTINGELMSASTIPLILAKIQSIVDSE